MGGKGKDRVDWDQLLRETWVVIYKHAISMRDKKVYETAK